MYSLLRTKKRGLLKDVEKKYDQANIHDNNNEMSSQSFLSGKVLSSLGVIPDEVCYPESTV